MTQVELAAYFEYSGIPFLLYHDRLKHELLSYEYVIPVEKRILYDYWPNVLALSWKNSRSFLDSPYEIFLVPDS